ncbi:MAG: FAD-dependent oxidoreductase [Lachnospiraceae bacterium]|nr:FAD-dependent oxidoreductase [Lachnospiraceae bacterium]
MLIRFSGIRLSLTDENICERTGRVSCYEMDMIINKICKLLKISEKDVANISVIKKSTDARKKQDVAYTYQVEAEISKNKIPNINRLKGKADVVKPKSLFDALYKRTQPSDDERPVVCGMGPAGLFAAYILALNGARPVIIEQGEKIEDRVETVSSFWNGEKKLNPFSNVSFGEGGAGTFSDGKLNTSVKDTYGRIDYVKRTFVSFGAPEEIIYSAKPHIGTDELRTVVCRMREEIIRLGGEVHFNTKLVHIDGEDKLNSVTVSNVVTGEERIIKCNKLVLAIGHSARDTYHMLKGMLDMESKDFAVGLRMQHKQSYINRLQYGDFADRMPAADYSLRYHTESGRAVYSFCMCPGGYVVNASSEDGHLVINGMSDHKRDSANANSAIVVNVTKDDFGNDIMAGIEFQRKLEKKAYELLSGEIPCQTYDDFKNNEVTTRDIKPVNKGQYSVCNIRSILPEELNEAIIEAMEHFSDVMEGFTENVVMAGVETRTSAPLRIIRDESLQSNISGVFPCGEGAGYAGGIMSAAVDGIKVAFCVLDLM